MTGPRLPDGFAVQVDRRVRVLGEGAALLGGSPTRLLRLAPAAQTMLNGGRLEVHDAQSAQLARTLLDATVAHPRPPSGPSHRDVTVVIPVRDNPSGIAAAGVDAARAARRRRRRRLGDPGAGIRLRGHALRRPGVAAQAQQGAGCRAQHRTGGVRHRPRRLPGLRRGAPARLAGGAARTLLRSRRGAGRAADRRPAPSDSVVARYEAVRSSLDLGLREAPVVPYGTVSYVPSAAIICRRRALIEVGGFDETLESGEDVDLCWRLIEAGARLRYEPIALVAHEHRTTARVVRPQGFYGGLRRRWRCGIPARRQPLVISGWTLVVWVLLASGTGLGYLASATVAVTGRRIANSLPTVETEPREVAVVAAQGLWSAALQLASAICRHYWPVALIAAVLSRRCRRWCWWPRCSTEWSTG